ncbi:MAG: GHKL domain-containing protein [Butyrivibrio sp.]|nr:GHKL domain-containing protein [Butyrivibrio sp.]
MISVLTALVETVFLYIWLKGFVNRRQLNYKIIAAVILIASIVRWFINGMENAALSMLMGIACSLIVSVILFNVRYGILFFYTIVNHAICVSAGCLSAHFLTGVPAVLALLAEAVLLAAILWAARKLPASKAVLNMKLSYTRNQGLVFDLVAVAIYGFAASLYILEDMLNMGMGTNIGFIIAEIVLIISVFAMVHLHWIFGVALGKAREVENINIHSEKIAEYYKNIEEIHEKYDTFIHDIKHQLRAVAALAEDGNCENISGIISQMRIDIGNIEKGLICSNKVLNALLLERKGYAEDNGVPMEMEIIEPLNFRNIQDIDLIALMGNLLDNAIYAQKHADKRDGIWLNMRMAGDGEHSIIHIENDYDKKHGVGKVIGKSVEKIGYKHGIGLNSVHDIVRKYGGIIESDKRNGRYVVDVILPIQDEREGVERQPGSSPAYLHLLSK